MHLSDLNENSTLADFIAFFEAIPDEKWCCGKFIIRQTGQCCAAGHLGERNGEPSQVVEHLVDLMDGRSITRINDGRDVDYPQPTPKARVIAYLTDVMNGVVK